MTTRDNVFYATAPDKAKDIARLTARFATAASGYDRITLVHALGMFLGAKMALTMARDDWPTLMASIDQAAMAAARRTAAGKAE
jgi:hypothetical protein